MQSSKELTLQFLVLCATSLLLAATLSYHIGKHIRRVKELHREKQSAKSERSVEKSTIILAFEIQNFIVNYSNCQKQGYKRLNSFKNISGKSIIQFIKYLQHLFMELEFLNPCFKARFTSWKIRKFFTDLKSLPFIKVVIYTKLQPHICSNILDDLNLNEIFTDSDRIYAKTSLLSASEVDHDTRRVVIITTQNQNIDFDMTSHHALILSYEKADKIQDEQLSKLKGFFTKVSQNGRVQNLHEQMLQLAVRLRLPVLNDEN